MCPQRMNVRIDEMYKTAKKKTLLAKKDISILVL
jgi:hypothetical protein